MNFYKISSYFYPIQPPIILFSINNSEALIFPKTEISILHYLLQLIGKNFVASNNTNWGVGIVRHWIKRPDGTPPNATDVNWGCSTLDSASCWWTWRQPIDALNTCILALIWKTWMKLLASGPALAIAGIHFPFLSPLYHFVFQVDN